MTLSCWMGTHELVQVNSKFDVRSLMAGSDTVLNVSGRRPVRPQKAQNTIWTT